jgi:nucleotide-binding universal stress UspA family protein
MFRNVLVAIDGSEHSRAALKEASDLASATHAKLTIMTCYRANADTEARAWATGLQPEEAKAIQGMQRTAAERANDFLEQARSEVLPGVPSETLAVLDDPADGILAQIPIGGHDLVIMGSRGRGRLASRFLGSVSQEVLRHSPVPVLVIRMPQESEPDQPQA